MKRLVLVLALSCPWLGMAAETESVPLFYGVGLCQNPNFQCVKIEHSQSWESMFPDEQQRDVVQRLNRSYNYLYAGRVIAVPKNLKQANLLDFSPFPQKVKPDIGKQVIVDQNLLAWGAYDKDGHLVKWGPVSSGRTKCPDSNNKCLTLTGVFRVFSKENDKCKSDIFPIGKGGAKMPYCMYFHKGFALHGSDDIPGYRASHGCIRMFVRDAKWLNETFVDVANESKKEPGTKIVVRPVTLNEKKS
jgi:hypothetical protein